MEYRNANYGTQLNTKNLLKKEIQHNMVTKKEKQEILSYNSITFFLIKCEKHHNRKIYIIQHQIIFSE